MSARWLPVTCRTAAQRVLAERGGLGVSVGFYLVVVAVLAGLWRAAVDANGGDIAGYSAVALTWYIATSEAATVSLNIRMIDDVGNDIGSGAVAVELLRPASVLGVRVATEIGRAIPRLAAIALAGAVLATVTAGAPPQPLALALAVPSLVLAISCNIVAQHAFAGVAFWLRNAGSTWFLYQKLVFVLGGMLIPLEVLPDWLEHVVWVLPFRAMAYIPARLASGHVEPVLLVEQIAWLAVLAAAAIAVFDAGERKLQVVGGVRALFATTRNVFAEAAADRAALGWAMAVMAVNDLVWIAFWVLFFNRVGEIRGWDSDRILLLLAVITSAAGISLGVLANARRIGVMAVEGDLDAVLSLPVPPLAYLLLRRIEPTNIGDLAFGIALFALTGSPTPARTLVFIIVVLVAATLLTVFLVLTGSIAFFAGRSEGGDLGFHAMILLGSYPVDVFAGMAKVVLYSVVPAVFVSSVPAKLIDSFDLVQLVRLVAVALVFATAAWSTFTVGLRRYTSGAVWTRA